MQNPRSLTRPAVAILACLAALTAGSGSAAAQEETQRSALSLDPARQTAVGQVLTAPDAAPEGLASALVALGPAHLPEVFAVLIDGRVTLVEGGAARSVQLSSRLAAPVRTALAQAPRAALRSFLRALAEGQPNEAEQRTALDVLGGLGGRDDLNLLVRLAEPARGKARVGRDVRSAFDRALGALRTRCAFTPRELSQAFTEAHPAYSGVLIAALGECDARQALVELAGLLGRVPEADGLLLAEIGDLGAGLPAPVDSDVTGRTRGYLGSVRGELAVEAVVTAGKLRDAGAIPDLVGLLRDPLAAPRASEVLRALSGQRYSGADSWEAWYAMERTWWERAAPERLALLRTGTPAEVAQVLMEVSRKRLFRDELALDVAEVLERDEPDLVRLACSVLGYLGSALVLPELEAAEQHDSTEVRAEARKALEAIRGSSRVN